MERDGAPDCMFCAAVESMAEPDGGWVYMDELVRVSAPPLLPVPGWLVLHTVRHVVGLAGLSDAEASGVGQVATLLARTISTRTGGLKVYTYAMCERVEHFHMLLGAPPRGEVDGARGGALLARVISRDPALLDQPATIREARAIAASLARR